MMRLTSSLPAMILGGLVTLVQQTPAFLVQIVLIMINYRNPPSPSRPSSNDGPPRVRVESRDFQMLSGLRGLAALVVLFRHINVGGYIGGYQGLQELGVFMVATFFVLSAFLLSFRALRDDIPLWGYAEAHLGLRNWIFSNHSHSVVSGRTRAAHIAMEVLRPAQYWTKYLLRRFFRVWPLFAFIVICAHIWPEEVRSRLYGAFGGPILDSFLMRDRLLGREMAQFWSLRPEFSYYLLIPLYIVTWKTAETLDGVHVIQSTPALPESERPSIFTQRYAWSRKTSRIAHFVISLMVCLYQTTYNPLRNASHQHQYVGPYLPVFWAGTAGAVIFHILLQIGWTVNPHKIASQKSPQGWFSFAVLGDIIGFAIVAGVIASDDWYYAMITGHPQIDHWWSWGPRKHEDGSEVGPVMMQWAGVIVSGYLLCMTVLTPRGINSRLLSNPLLVRAGDISFSIYSVHPWVDSWMRAHVIPEWLKGVDCLVVILVGIWITAEFTYRFIEMPCMRLGNALCGKVDEAARRIEGNFKMGYYQQVGIDEEEIDIEDLGMERGKEQVQGGENCEIDVSTGSRIP